MSLEQEEEKQQIAQMGGYKIHNSLLKKVTIEFPATESLQQEEKRNANYSNG